MATMTKIRESNLHHLTEFDPYQANGKYQMPSLRAERHIPTRLIDFNTAIRSKINSATVHFYLDDSRFERVWHDPYRYLQILKRFDSVFTPDFSLFLDMPLAMKIWNIYRSRLIGQMMQQANLTVIPTVSWAEPETFEFCFDGLPSGGTVSISTVGIMRTEESRKVFERGFTTMVERITPSQIILYGKCPEFIKTQDIPIYSYTNTSFAWKNNNQDVNYQESI